MKGFKKDGKFRPTEKRNKHSLSKDDVKRTYRLGGFEGGQPVSLTKTELKKINDNVDIENQNIVIGKNEHLKNYYGKRTKSTLEPKLDSRVEEQFSSGNPEEMIWWKVNDVTANPDVDGKVIPLDFYIYTVIDQQNHEDEDTYIANLVAVPRKFGKKYWQVITDSVGDTPEVNKEVVNIDDALQYGDAIPIRDVKDAKSSAEAINKVLENISADAGAIGFTLDRQIHPFGETGWDRLSELALDKKMTSKELIARQNRMYS